MASISSYATSAGRRYRVRYRTPDRRQTDKRGFTTKRDAELFLASVEVSIARGDFVAANLAQVALGEWAATWLSAQVQLKPSTAQGYATIVNGKIIPKWGSVPLGSLTHSGIQAWISEETKRVKPATVRSYHRLSR
jgi:hypothetical protein